MAVQYSVLYMYPVRYSTAYFAQYSCTQCVLQRERTARAAPPGRRHARTPLAQAGGGALLCAGAAPFWAI